MQRKYSASLRTSNNQEKGGVSVTLHRDSLWRITLFAFFMGMVSGAGLYHSIRALLAVGGVA
jgi:hypothetical protein